MSCTMDANPSSVATCIWKPLVLYSGFVTGSRKYTSSADSADSVMNTSRGMSPHDPVTITSLATRPPPQRETAAANTRHTASEHALLAAHVRRRTVA